MAKTTRGILRRVATRSIIAALPIAIASAYASGLFIEPPRLAQMKYEQVAEITTTPNTIGIATSPLYGQSKAEIEQQLDDLLSIGVTTIRVFVPWGLVEPLDNIYNWSSIDDIMSAAAARNMGVMAQVNATPIWGGANGPGFPIGSGAPNVGAFTDFMGVFANRYGETVSAYEIWNEPNYYQFFNPINPEAYTDLLKAVYPILKAVDPTATVVAGAVGATQTFGGLTMSPVEFVQRMLAAGAADFFDALSVHPYGDQIPYSGSCPSCPSNVLTPRQQVEAIMAMLDGKKVWITEYGLSTAPGGFTEAQQAAWIKDLLDHWQTYDPDLVGPIFLYTIRDALNPQDPASLENFYGLWNALGGEKASADMLRDWIAAHPVVTDPGTPPDTGTPPNPVAQIVAALQQVVQAVVEVVRTGIQAVANFVRAIVQTVVDTISNIVGVLRPPASAATTLVSDTVDPAAALVSASLVSEPEAAEASKAAAEGDTLKDAKAVLEKAVTPAVDPAAEVPVEPVAEPVLDEPVIVEPVLVEPVLVEPVAVEPVEPVVAPVETPTEVETEAPAPEAEATPAASEPTASESDDESSGKPSADSSSASATKPATKPTKTDDDESSNKSGASTSRTPAKSDTSEPSSAAKVTEKPAKSTAKDSNKRETVSAAAGATSSDSSSSGGSDG
jgi:hypothetical protein